MEKLKSSLIFVFIITLVLISISAQAVEINEPSSSQCRNSWHYNGDLGDCSLLFDQNHTTGYIWRQSETWVAVTYDEYMLDAEMHTVSMDSGEELTNIPSECLLHEGLKVNISNFNSFTCWNGSSWISFGSGLGGWQPNVFYELFLDQTPGGNVPNEPEMLGPLDGAINQPLNPFLQAKFTDDNYNTLDVIFYDASDNSILYTFDDVAVDTVVEYQWNGLVSDTVYSWYVKSINNEGSRKSDIYSFTTGVNNAPYLDSRQPDDDLKGTDTSVSLNFNVNDIDVGDLIDVTFYNAVDDSVLTTVNGLTSGSSAVFTWSGLLYSTNYQWYAVLNDSKDFVQTSTWNFTTQAEPQQTPPTTTNNNGGGGGGSSIPTILTSKMFRNLMDNNKELFRLDHKLYTFEVIEIGDDFVKLTFSNGDIFTLNAEEYVYIDLDNDDEYDIKSTLVELNGNRATILIERFTGEELVEEPIEEPTAPVESEQPEEPIASEPESSESTFSNLITGATVFTESIVDYDNPAKLIVTIFAIYLLVKKRFRLLRKILRTILFRIPRVQAIRQRLKSTMKDSKKSLEDYGFRIKGKYGKFRLWFK
jgi:hypothetical protein